MVELVPRRKPRCVDTFSSPPWFRKLPGGSLQHQKTSPADLEHRQAKDAAALGRLPKNPTGSDHPRCSPWECN